VTIFYGLRYETSLFITSYDSQVYCEGIRPRLHMGFCCECKIQSQSYITTDGQSASLSWNKAPIWGLRSDLCYCQPVAGLFMWDALSDERTGLSSAAGPRQRSHSRVRIPWRSRPYFTVSDSKFFFVAFYDSQGHGRGIRPRLHTGDAANARMDVFFSVPDDEQSPQPGNPGCYTSIISTISELH
jgi:hypothetical protein